MGFVDSPRERPGDSAENYELRLGVAPATPRAGPGNWEDRKEDQKGVIRYLTCYTLAYYNINNEVSTPRAALPPEEGGSEHQGTTVDPGGKSGSREAGLRKGAETREGRRMGIKTVYRLLSYIQIRDYAIVIQ